MQAVPAAGPERPGFYLPIYLPNSPDWYAYSARAASRAAQRQCSISGMSRPWRLM